MPLFRVQFVGPPLTDPEADAGAAGAEFETGLGFPDNVRFRHHFLVDRAGPEEAIAALRVAVERRGGFSDFAASEVTPPPGWRGLGRDVDWADVATRCDLTELQQTLLDNLFDAAEPTWIVLEDPDTGGDRDAVEGAMRDLEQRDLVSHTDELSGNPDRPFGDRDDWWAITDHGWEMLGLIKRPSYR